MAARMRAGNPWVRNAFGNDALHVALDPEVRAIVSKLVGQLHCAATDVGKLGCREVVIRSLLRLQELKSSVVEVVGGLRCLVLLVCLHIPHCFIQPQIVPPSPPRNGMCAGFGPEELVYMCSACQLSFCEDASGMMMVAAYIDQPIRKPIRLCRWVCLSRTVACVSCVHHAVPWALLIVRVVTGVCVLHGLLPALHACSQCAFKRQEAEGILANLMVPQTDEASEPVGYVRSAGRERLLWL